MLPRFKRLNLLKVIEDSSVIIRFKFLLAKNNDISQYNINIINGVNTPSSANIFFRPTNIKAYSQPKKNDSIESF